MSKAFSTNHHPVAATGKSWGSKMKFLQQLQNFAAATRKLCSCNSRFSVNAINVAQVKLITGFPVTVNKPELVPFGALH